MAKKNRVQFHCQICNKTTMHEVRPIDGQDSCICLVCKSTPQIIKDNPELHSLIEKQKTEDMLRLKGWGW